IPEEDAAFPYFHRLRHPDEYHKILRANKWWQNTTELEFFFPGRQGKPLSQGASWARSFE
ncbi:hypothetical protein, partial [Clostridium botulinum]|uniref:hypothetical protein n=1 Tax=Clostridium botulinum TaxID=1491 RepID=UPI001E4412EC